MSSLEKSSPQDGTVQDKPKDGHAEYSEEGIYVALTHDHLDPLAIMNKVRSPSAGAIVLFAGKDTLLLLIWSLFSYFSIIFHCLINPLCQHACKSLVHRELDSTTKMLHL